jgi:hypothetical protein
MRRELEGKKGLDCLLGYGEKLNGTENMEEARGALR